VTGTANLEAWMRARWHGAAKRPKLPGRHARRTDVDTAVAHTSDAVYNSHMGEWHEKGVEMALAIHDDVATVRTITTRDDTGVDYEIRCGLRSAGDHAYEEGEGECVVWTGRVDFGQTDATVAGGAAFLLEAREQERAAGAIWRRSHPAEPRVVHLDQASAAILVADVHAAGPTVVVLPEGTRVATTDDVERMRREGIVER
jgi:hypothetical protein